MNFSTNLHDLRFNLYHNPYKKEVFRICQISRAKLNSRIKECLVECSGEPKLIGEWNVLINERLPRSRRLTVRELARLFVFFGKKGDFVIEHSSRSYAFYQSPLVPASSSLQKR